MFYSAGYAGFITNVTDWQKSSKTGNRYFDLHMKTSVDESNRVRFMLNSNTGVKRELFIEKKENSHPVHLKNLTPGGSGIVFFNSMQSSSLEDGSHLVDFKYSDDATVPIALLKTKQTTGGTFSVEGQLKWTEDQKTVQLKQKQSVTVDERDKESPKTEKVVREGLLHDGSEYIEIAMWESLAHVEEEKWYHITCVSTKDVHGIKLSTTLLSEAIKMPPRQLIDWSNIQLEDYKTESKKARYADTILFCPDIVNVKATPYPCCTNAKCKKKVNIIANEPLVRCFACSRKMLAEKCPLTINCVIEVEADAVEKTLTAFEDEMSSILEVDVQEYANKIEELEIKLLALQKVDFKYNNKNIITSMELHK